MRPLTEEETKKFFEKLGKYIGRNIKHLLEREDGKYVFRLHKSRVYYASESLLGLAQSVPRKDLVIFGQCVGKFTKSGSFHLKVTSLPILLRYAKFRVWVKGTAGGEMSYLYGNHVTKSSLLKITSATPKYQGVVVLNPRDVPLGFATTAHSTAECREVDPTAIVAYNQSDCGEYLRDESKIL